MEHHYTTTHETEARRVRWVYDEEYRSEGSYAYDTEEETAAAVLAEEEGLAGGSLVALGAIVETRCPGCSEWAIQDSLWGIVVQVDTDLEKYGSEILDIPPTLAEALEALGDSVQRSDNGELITALGVVRSAIVAADLL
jgi:hypothetical protein